MQFTYPDIKRAITSRCTVLEPAITHLELEWHPDPPGPYTLVGQVLVPFIDLLLERPKSDGRDSALLHGFALVEDFLGELDPEIANMIYVELLEWRRATWYERAVPFLGIRALSALDEYDEGWRTRKDKDDDHVELGAPHGVITAVDELLRART